MAIDGQILKILAKYDYCLFFWFQPWCMKFLVHPCPCIFKTLRKTYKMNHKKSCDLKTCDFYFSYVDAKQLMLNTEENQISSTWVNFFLKMLVLTNCRNTKSKYTPQNREHHYRKSINKADEQKLIKKSDKKTDKKLIKNW